MNNYTAILLISWCIVFFCSLIVNCEAQPTPEKLYNCTGDIFIKDSEGKSYEFFENTTEVEDNNFHEATWVTATVTGDCCFVVYSEVDADGNEQYLVNGEQKLEISSIGSVFIISCDRPWWKHPLLHFFIWSLIIIGILYYIYTKGKELLLRRRV